MKKTKKRPNLFDIVILLVLLGIMAVVWFLVHGSGEGTETVTRTYTIELDDLEPGMEKGVSVGDPVTDNVKNYAMGTVVEMSTEPCIALTTDQESGTLRSAQVPGKITLYLTVEAETQETEKNITTVSGYDLKVGTSVSCTVGQLTAPGYIIQVER